VCRMVSYARRLGVLLGLRGRAIGIRGRGVWIEDAWDELVGDGFFDVNSLSRIQLIYYRGQWRGNPPYVYGGSSFGIGIDSWSLVSEEFVSSHWSLGSMERGPRVGWAGR
jgi:hypothetical protein